MSKKTKQLKKKKTMERIPVKEPSLQVSSQSYSGPIPPAAEMERYHAINPDLVDRIIALAEGEAESRRKIESKSLEASIQLSERQSFAVTLGQIFGLLIGMSGFACAAYLGACGLETAASIIGGATLSSMVAVFVVGNKLKQTEK